MFQKIWPSKLITPDFNWISDDEGIFFFLKYGFHYWDYDTYYDIIQEWIVKSK